MSLAVRLPTEQYFEVVFSAAYATNAGTFSATLTSPGTPTITTVTNTSIRVGPKSQTVLSGHTTKLEVFALGPLPHTWQWFSGTNLDSTKPILGATNESFTTPPLTQDTSYWVRVTGPAGAGTVKSGTAVINIANNPDAFYTGTLVTNGCRLPNGDLYGVQRFEIQQQGNYVFTISNGFSATTYQGVFDAQNPSNNFYGVLNGHYAAGSYDLVVRSTNAGSFGGTITGGPAVVKLLVPLAPQFISNPQDVTITNNQSVTLGVSTTCGTLFSLQWFKGESGDTSLPVAGATGFNYTTPLLTTTTKYWVRMIYPGGTNYSAHATVFLEVLPAYQDGELTACDRRFERPSSLGDLSGTNCFYKTFVYRVSQSGAYTFTVNSTGFVAKVHLYESSFLPNNPVVSLSYLGSTGTFVRPQIFSVNPKYLVVSGLNSNDVGTFSVTVSNGPAAITLTRAPVITSQPASTNLLRNQAATLSVGSTTPGLLYQWYGGTDCGAKTPIAGANSATFTTPPLTVYTNYWVELSGAGGYVFSTNAAVRIQPQGVTDNYVVNEDETLDATNSVLLNDLKADNRTLGVGLDVNPAHGTLMFFQTGVFVYRPETNYQGPDSFIYRIGDGTLITTNITVNIKVIEVNDPPVRTSGSFSNVFAVEDGTNVSMQLANANYNPGGGADEAGQRLFFRPTSLPNALGRVLLANQSTVVNTNSDYDLTQLRGMIFDPATNAFGTGTFDFTVKDNGRTDGGNDPRSITQSVNIVVSEVIYVTPRRRLRNDSQQ